MRRVRELDSIRGFAALVVIAFHLWFLGPTSKVGLFSIMGLSVDLFFVLSGYLITAIIIGNAGTPGFLLNFYARRSLRIWPIYYLTLLGWVAVRLATGDQSGFGALPYYLTYTQMAWAYGLGHEPAVPECFSHLWTLAIEEQFYLFWPALLLLAGRRSVVPLALGLVAISVVARFAGYSDRILIARCDGFGFGGLLAAVLAAPVPRRAFVTGALLVGAAGVAWILASRSFLQSWGLRPLNLVAINAFFAATVGLVAVSAGRPALAALRDPRFVYIGTISYGLYLYHLFVIGAADALAAHFGLSAGAWLTAVKVAATLATAALSWRLVERPILALKHRFDYDRPVPVSAAPP
jgi:peptidoglycan/LPS O-acetylase OafA/YrhL